MLRRTNTLRPQSQSKPPRGSAGSKDAAVCIRRAVEGLAKRRECQAFGRIMAQMPKSQLRTNRIKLIFFLSQQYQLRLKASAFDRLARMKFKNEFRVRTTNIIGLVCERIRKDKIRQAIQKMRLGGMMFSPIRAKSVGPRLSDDLKSPILEVSQQESYEGISPALNKDLKTTLNIILAALSGRKFKDVKRQVEHFLKRSGRGDINSILRQLLGLIEEIETNNEGNRLKEKAKLEVSNALGQVDRQLRNEKVEQLEKLKNRWRNNENLAEVVAVVESVVAVWGEVKKLRRKESTSADRELRSAEKVKEKKNLETDNAQLKKEVKRLEMQCQRLENQKKQLQGKKGEQRRSLPPKRPTLNQERQDPQQLRQLKLREGELNKQITAMNKQSQTLNKQMQGLRNQLSSSSQQAKKNQESLQSKYSELQANFETKKGELQVSSNKLRSWQNGWGLLTTILQKKQERTSFARQLNELKRLQEHPLVEHANRLLAYETDRITIITQFDKLCTAFEDGSWKRKNMLSREQGELWQGYNRVIELTVGLGKEKQDAGRVSKELESSRRKEVNMSEAVSRSKEENDKLRSELSELKQSRRSVEAEERSPLRRSPQKAESNAELQRLRAENSKMKEGERGLNREIKQLRQENNRIKLDNEKLKKLSESTTSTNLQLSKTIQELQKELNVIQSDFAQLQSKPRSSPSPPRPTQSSPQMTRKDGTIRQLENKVTRLETQLSSSKERAEQMRTTLEKVRAERDNLKLVIEEKDEEVELMRESSEQHLEEKRVSQSKIIDLKHSHETTEVEIRKVEVEVERLLNEKETLQAQKNELQQRYQQQTLTLRRELEETRALLTNHNGQDTELRQRLQVQNQDIVQLQDKHSATVRELRQKCEGLLSQITSSRTSHDEERRALEAKVRQLEGARRLGSAQDEQKAELRLQLQKRNGELAECVRSNEKEKMDLRKMIDKVSGEMQAQMALHTEEKKMLREEAERARSEEYELNQQKIRKQREGISELREENQRLTTIIDANQESFNQLIQDHQAMTHKISTLQQQNQGLLGQLSASEVEKASLLRKLQPLQEKLVEFEGRILTAMQERALAQSEQLRGSQSRINALQSLIDQSTEEKRELVVRVGEQSREMIKLQGEVMRMGAELRGRSEDGEVAVEGERRQYVAYLEEQLGIKQQELVRTGAREKELIVRVEGYVERVAKLERQRNDEARVRGQKDLELAKIQGEYQKQIILIQDKIVALQEVITRKDQQLSHLKGSQVQAIHSQQHLQTIRILESEKHEALLDNHKLKAQVERAAEELAQAKTAVQQHQKTLIENKHLTIRTGQLQKDVDQLEHEKATLQQETLRLRGQLQDNQYNSQLDSHMEFFKERSTGLLREEELLWARAQLSSKEQELQQARRDTIEAQAELNKQQEAIHRAQEAEERLRREVEMHNQSRQRVTQIEQAYQSSLEQLRRREHQLTQELTRKEEVILRARHEHLHHQQEKVEFPKRGTNGRVLREIAGQLGGADVSLEGDQDEVELRILLRISEEVSELMIANTRLRNKCRELEECWQGEGRELWWEETVVCLEGMLAELTVFVETHDLLPSSVVVSQPRFTRNSTPQQCVANASAFIKEIVMLCSAPHIVQQYGQPQKGSRVHEQPYRPYVQSNLNPQRQILSQPL